MVFMEKKSPKLPVTNKHVPFTELDAVARDEFVARIESLQEPVKSILLKSYANPAYAKLAALEKT